MGHGLYSKLIDFFTVHNGQRRAVFPAGVGHRLGNTAANSQEITARTVCAHSTAKDTIAGGYTADDSGTGTIAKEDARSTVLPVDDAAQYFCANDQDMIIHAIFNHLGSDNRAIGKAGAGRFQIKSSCMDGA